MALSIFSLSPFRRSKFLSPARSQRASAAQQRWKEWINVQGHLSRTGPKSADETVTMKICPEKCHRDIKFNISNHGSSQQCWANNSSTTQAARVEVEVEEVVGKWPTEVTW